jgi:uncharacterized Zn-binding protein involved in type VI secretion
MPAAARLGDVSTGHGGFPPNPSTSGDPTVLINGLPAVTVGSTYATHCSGKSCHGSTQLSGSPTVFVNGKPLARVGDPIQCGDGSIETVAVGSSNVFSG